MSSEAFGWIWAYKKKKEPTSPLNKCDIQVCVKFHCVCRSRVRGPGDHDADWKLQASRTSSQVSVFCLLAWRFHARMTISELEGGHFRMSFRTLKIGCGGGGNSRQLVLDHHIRTHWKKVFRTTVCEQEVFGSGRPFAAKFLPSQDDNKKSLTPVSTNNTELGGHVYQNKTWEKDPWLKGNRKSAFLV